MAAIAATVVIVATVAAMVIEAIAAMEYVWPGVLWGSVGENNGSRQSKCISRGCVRGACVRNEIAGPGMKSRHLGEPTSLRCAADAATAVPAADGLVERDTRSKTGRTWRLVGEGQRRRDGKPCKAVHGVHHSLGGGVVGAEEQLHIEHRARFKERRITLQGLVQDQPVLDGRTRAVLTEKLCLPHVKVGRCTCSHVRQVRVQRKGSAAT